MLRFSFACLFLFTSIATACGAGTDIPAAIEGVKSSDPAAAAQSVATLRAAGPAGLAALLKHYDAAPDPNLIGAIDAVAAQRGAVVSRLFWFTDLAGARAAAKAANKPILYLRMMGKLTDEYSCANSRFFRTVLYANTEVSKVLREQFVLVWISERPVPVVTIDYGDGRVLKRTLTGNSIHYILDSDGRVIDALPGLYAPKTFLSALSSARTVALAANGNQEQLSRYLANAETTLLRDWQSDLALAAVGPMSLNNPKGQVGQLEQPTTVVFNPAANPAAAPAAPPAAAAMRRAFSKTAVEAPIIARLSPQVDPQPLLNPASSIEMADATTWEKVAALHLADARLDASSIAMIRTQNPKAYQDPAALNKIVERFQTLIAADTVHNNYQLRRQIISWLRQSPGKLSVEQLNERVYSELFLTPRTDPWLGLAPDEYTALNGNGCEVAKR
ncbi:MAG TPA: hypothetical protein VFE47_29215 [Tepidisphaeraceae bacterium]|jgi:hypothetical protein|nr:hypothetical protein [Tepidisphaeraceae bacterium]